MRREGYSRHKGSSKMTGNNSNSSSSRKRPYGMLLLLALGAALLSVMLLHKMRERRIFGLVLQDRDTQLIALQLLLQKEKEHSKEIKRKLENVKTKAAALRTDKNELTNKLTELQGTSAYLRNMIKDLETGLEEKQNHINILTQKQAESIQDSLQVAALTGQLKEREAEVEELKQQLLIRQTPENATVAVAVENVVKWNDTAADNSEKGEVSKDRQLEDVASSTDGRTPVEVKDDTPKEGQWVMLQTNNDDRGVEDGSESSTGVDVSKHGDATNGNKNAAEVSIDGNGSNADRNAEDVSNDQNQIKADRSAVEVSEDEGKQSEVNQASRSEAKTSQNGEQSGEGNEKGQETTLDAQNLQQSENFGAEDNKHSHENEHSGDGDEVGQTDTSNVQEQKEKIKNEEKASSNASEGEEHAIAKDGEAEQLKTSLQDGKEEQAGSTESTFTAVTGEQTKLRARHGKKNKSRRRRRKVVLRAEELHKQDGGLSANSQRYENERKVDNVESNVVDQAVQVGHGESNASEGKERTVSNDARSESTANSQDSEVTAEEHETAENRNETADKTESENKENETRESNADDNRESNSNAGNVAAAELIRNQEGEAENKDGVHPGVTETEAVDTIRQREAIEVSNVTDDSTNLQNTSDAGNDTSDAHDSTTDAKDETLNGGSEDQIGENISNSSN